MGILACRMKEYIQPFERRLAIQELDALTGCTAIPVDGDDATALTFEVTTHGDSNTLRSALAYWRSVGDTNNGLTVQVRNEATSLIAQNGAKIEELPRITHSLVQSCIPKKRCLRYATHGLHEYRGKFFPQLVRALMNVAKLPSDAIVLDPMCGSGTTLVEARLTGRKCYGIDMNPLSVFISGVKCESLTLQPSELIAAFDIVRTGLDELLNKGSETRINLEDRDQFYLKRWFDSQTLYELDGIDGVIKNIPNSTLRKFYRVCLSNILREMSWQKTDDLRVRRDVVAYTQGEVYSKFHKEALRSTRMVVAFLAENSSTSPHGHHVHHADARCAVNVLPRLVGKVDAVITSPPYATALPYIDTDRLSLIYLGLLPREGHRALDLQMIGNREITKRQLTEYWHFYEKHNNMLPNETRYLIERIDRLNKSESVGFRRKNLSALLARYFFDMHATMKQVQILLRPGGIMFLVVGNNRTTAGSEPVEIQTADHLAKIAVALGFRITDRLSMDMLISREIFRKNAVPSEQILTLEKPQ